MAFVSQRSWMNKGTTGGKETNKEYVSILPAVRGHGSMDVQTHGKAWLTAFPRRWWTMGKEHEEKGNSRESGGRQTRVPALMVTGVCLYEVTQVF